MLNIKELRKLSNLNQTEFAKKIGKSKNTIINWESGKTSPTQADIEDIEEVFGISVQNIVPSAVVKRIPFYDVDAAGGHNGGDMTQTSHPTGTIDIGDILRDSEAALRISGNSMMPGYPPGCVVGLIKRKGRNIEPGEVYVYETDDGRYIKRLFFKNDDPSSDTYICYSDSIMKFDSGPREGKYCYPPYELKIADLINLFTVVGVIKRNSNGLINYKSS